MTTIATDGKTMAGDSLTAAGGDVWLYAPKVGRAADGSVFGGCGPAVCNQRFRRYMQTGGKWPELSDDFSALVLTPAGETYWIDKRNERILMMVPAAIGSGESFAIGAMLAGATTAHAIGIAGQRDTRTGGDITIMSPGAE